MQLRWHEVVGPSNSWIPGRCHLYCCVALLYFSTVALLHCSSQLSIRASSLTKWFPGAPIGGPSTRAPEQHLSLNNHKYAAIIEKIGATRLWRCVNAIFCHLPCCMLFAFPGFGDSLTTNCHKEWLLILEMTLDKGMCGAAFFSGSRRDEKARKSTFSQNFTKLRKWKI